MIQIYLRAGRNSCFIYINQSGYCECSKTCASFIARIEQFSMPANLWATQTCARFSASNEQVTGQKLYDI